jgi:hypothetical protein
VRTLSAPDPTTAIAARKADSLQRKVVAQCLTSK